METTQKTKETNNQPSQDHDQKNNKEKTTKHGHSGKNILTNSRKLSPEEQKEAVSSSSNVGRITHIENKLDKHDRMLGDISSNITKMMFIIVVISVCLASFKFGSIIHSGVDAQQLIELLFAVLLSFFGVRSTYSYTQQHPEKGNFVEQIKDASVDIMDDATKYVLVQKTKGK